MWNLPVIPKIRNFLWRVIARALPTKVNIFKRKCPLCDAFEETEEHAILLCLWVSCVWFGSPLSYKPDGCCITTFDVWLQSLETVSPRHTTGLPLAAFAGIIGWELWKERCRAVFNELLPCPQLVLAKSLASIAEQCKLHPPFPTRTPPSNDIVWQAPLALIIKINVDGAWSKDTMAACTGCVIRDYRGHSLGGESRSCTLPSPEEMEAMAVLMGLNLAAELGHQNIVVECDAKNVVDCITKKRTMASWKIFPILSAIWRKTQDFQYVHWNWVPRMANQAAHAAAKVSNARVGNFRWMSQPPSSLVSVLSRDVLPYPRYFQA